MHVSKKKIGFPIHLVPFSGVCFRETANMKLLNLFLQEEELQEMISASRDLEDTYGKLFDLTVVNRDIDEAYNSILKALERLEREEQWVPVEWVQTS